MIEKTSALIRPAPILSYPTKLKDCLHKILADEYAMDADFIDDDPTTIFSLTNTSWSPQVRFINVTFFIYNLLRCKFLSISVNIICILHDHTIASAVDRTIYM